MAYNGWLIKVGNYIIPTSIIQADSYQVYLNMQDYEPWTDGNGYLHRDVVSLDTSDGYMAAKVEFNTVPMLNNTQFASLMENIRNNFTNARGRECNITVYIPETDSYVTQKAYMADFKPQMYFADSSKIQYDAVRLAFIGGVYKGD